MTKIIAGWHEWRSAMRRLPQCRGCTMIDVRPYGPDRRFYHELGCPLVAPYMWLQRIAWIAVAVFVLWAPYHHFNFMRSIGHSLGRDTLGF
jgi:hypothetical protein